MRDAPPTYSAHRDGRGTQRAPSREVWPAASAEPSVTAVTLESYQAPQASDATASPSPRAGRCGRARNLGEAGSAQAGGRALDGGGIPIPPSPQLPPRNTTG